MLLALSVILATMIAPIAMAATTITAIQITVSDVMFPRSLSWARSAMTRWVTHARTMSSSIFSMLLFLSRCPELGGGGGGDLGGGAGSRGVRCGGCLLYTSPSPRDGL